MLIGINATAAFKQPRTGVEEYTYQLIKSLTMLEESRQHRFLLYAPAHLAGKRHELPSNFQVKRLNWPRPMWTQARLAWEVLWHQPDSLFIPVHVLPIVHPKRTIVTIHGLEYEHYPELYPQRTRRYLRLTTKYALRNSKKIITVSQSTKKDLIDFYHADPDKIEVVCHGIAMPKKIKGKDKQKNTKPYILFIGRLETKKNVHGLIEAFDILKAKYKIPHQLILVGPLGHGYEEVKIDILNSKYRQDIIEKGYVSEKEKKSLLRNADLFALPSFYEGFGMPVLEAQSYGVPVLTSDISSMPEVAGQGAILIHPQNAKDIAEGIFKIIDKEEIRNDLIAKGYDNIKRFNWSKCASQTLKILLE